MIKKLLSFLVIISILTIGAYAKEYFDVTEDANYKTPIDVLDTLGIVTTPDFEFQPYKEITRGEFVQYIANLIGATDYNANTVELYTDVPYDYPYFNAIQALGKMKIISGYSNSTFQPDEKITNQQAIKILVNAIGYGDIAENGGGFPTGYVAKASNLKLLSGINFKTQNLQKSEAVMLLYNALETEVIQTTSFGEEERFEAIKGQTVLSYFLKCGVVKDILKKNSTTTLTNSTTNMIDGYVQIGDTKYNIGETTANGYLGYKVKAYYKQETTDDDKVLLYIAPYQTDVNVIPAKGIASIQNKKLSYWLDVENKEKTKTVTISPKVDVIYNGKAYPEYKEAEFKIDEGFLTLVDNDTDNIYDVVLITSYEDCIVSSVNTRDKIVYFKQPENTKLDLYDIDEKDLLITDKDGKSMEINGLWENDVVTIAKSADKSYINITVSKEVVVGTLLSKADDIAEINYLNYDVAYGFKAQFSNLTVGYEGTFLLNARGTIVGVKEKTTLGVLYGYLKSVHKDKNLSDVIRVQILSQDGKFVECPVAKRLTVDGANSQTKEQFFDTFTTSKDGHYYTNMQLIKYQLDVNQQLKYVDSATKGIDEDSTTNLKALDLSQVNYKSATMLFVKKAYVTKDVILFTVPEINISDPLASNSFDKSTFKITQPNFADNTKVSGLLGYDIDDGGYCPVLVRGETYVNDYPIGGYNTAMDDTKCVVVDKITNAVNEMGESVPVLYYFEGGKTISMPANNENTLKKFVYNTTNTKYVKQGDIVRLSTNSSGEITGIQLVFDIERTDNARFVISTGQVAGFDFGKVYSKGKKGFRMSANLISNKDPVEFDFGVDKLQSWPIINIPITVYDSKNRKIYVGTINDILEYTTNGDNASLALVHSKYYEIKNLFIIK